MAAQASNPSSTSSMSSSSHNNGRPIGVVRLRDQKDLNGIKDALKASSSLCINNIKRARAHNTDTKLSRRQMDAVRSILEAVYKQSQAYSLHTLRQYRAHRHDVQLQKAANLAAQQSRLPDIEAEDLELKNRVDALQEKLLKDFAELQRDRDQVSVEIEKIVSDAKKCALQPIDDAALQPLPSISSTNDNHEWPSRHDLERIQKVRSQIDSEIPQLLRQYAAIVTSGRELRSALQTRHIPSDVDRLMIPGSATGERHIHDNSHSSGAADDTFVPSQPDLPSTAIHTSVASRLLNRVIGSLPIF